MGGAAKKRSRIKTDSEQREASHDDEDHELISFGEFVTLMWTIESDKEKKSALFAGGSSNFADLASYSKSIHNDIRSRKSLNKGAIDETMSALGSDLANVDLGKKIVRNPDMSHTYQGTGVK